MLQPWARTPDERDALIRLAAGARTRAVTSVTFIEPATSSRDESRPGGRFEVAGLGIGLDLDDSTRFLACWQMSGACEGLYFGPGDRPPTSVPEAPKRIDATDSPSWQSILGQRISTLDLVWHVPNDQCPPAVWAVKLGFGTASVALALAEPQDGGLDYQPDSVTAIFDETLADRLFRGADASAQVSETRV